MYTDPIADLLTRIRNASRANLSSCAMPYSKIKERLLEILTERKFIEKFEVGANGKFKELIVTIKANQDLNLKRISKPGQRIYIKKEGLRLIKSGLGIRIVSTSKGIMTGEEAKKQNVGGELICEIY